MCLWRCIAVYQGARPDRCTRATKQLAKGFFKSDLVPRTSLDELDKVEGYLNKGKQLCKWIGIRYTSLIGKKMAKYIVISERTPLTS